MRVTCATLIGRKTFSVEFPSAKRFGIREWLVVQAIGFAATIGQPFAVSAEG